MLLEFNKRQIKNFWRKVDKENSTVFYNGTKCWEWTASCRRGYGAFTFYKEVVYAHRTAWMLVKGEIPDDKPLMLHHCDNRKCVNPDHLFVGTYLDNNCDRNSKGRGYSPLGKKHIRKRILNKDDVIKIREMYENKTTVKNLSLMFDVSVVCIYAIIRRKTWKNLS